ncbi:Serine/threonine-protein kinase PrkC [Symmachiella dynata]|uniref:serine/threonine-protein kinase n=1 Tax=Symmachiella dynata TaxID=2527995 RepID=UPI00118935BC|nr:serine/threonine-protein kinase [Symmachiella dynata]QDT51746.1 Serine/threonine-protein kinase PrkC [Symmachiella dynata]
MPDSPLPNDSSERPEPNIGPTRALPNVSGTGIFPQNGGAGGQFQDLTEQTLGEFRVLRRIGRGGMAEVYLAQQTSLNRNVALKVLRPDLVSDETHVKRFRTEALAVAGLNHPNIIQVFSVGTENGFEYIAQEYVQGYNLRQYLVRKGPPDLPMALHIMKQVASALSAAAQAGIVHRDIKPENIMVTPKGRVKVADFGLAQLTLQGERVNLTQVGITMGTPLYMSPEQVNGSNVGHQSDLYSFGVTAYHMLAGSPPFRGETAVSVAVQHIKGEATPLEQSRPDLPILLCRIVHKLMAKELTDRYRTADAVLKDLKRVVEEQDNEHPLRGEAAMPTVEAGPQPSSTLSTISLPVQSLVRLPDRPLQNQLKPLLYAAAALFLLGFGAGWLALPADPLKTYELIPDPDVRRLDTVQEQVFYALKLGKSEPAWKAVIENFPDELYYHDLANRRLALLYLDEAKYSEAEAIFKDFIEAPASEPEKQAFGHAGKVLLFNEQGQFEESLQEFLKYLAPSESKSMVDDLDDGEMRKRLRAAVNLNLSKLNKPPEDKLKPFLNDAPEGPDEGAPAP